MVPNQQCNANLLQQLLQLCVWPPLNPCKAQESRRGQHMKVSIAGKQIKQHCEIIRITKTIFTDFLKLHTELLLKHKHQQWLRLVSNLCMKFYLCIGRLCMNLNSYIHKMPNQLIKKYSAFAMYNTNLLTLSRHYFTRCK